MNRCALPSVAVDGVWPSCHCKDPAPAKLVADAAVENRQGVGGWGGLQPTWALLGSGELAKQARHSGCTMPCHGQLLLCEPAGSGPAELWGLLCLEVINYAIWQGNAVRFTAESATDGPERKNTDPHGDRKVLASQTTGGDALCAQLGRLAEQGHLAGFLTSAALSPSKSRSLLHHPPSNLPPGECLIYFAAGVGERRGCSLSRCLWRRRRNAQREIQRRHRDL